MVGEALTPVQKLVNRYVFNGAVFAGLAAFVVGRFAWVRSAILKFAFAQAVANYSVTCTQCSIVE